MSGNVDQGRTTFSGISKGCALDLWVYSMTVVGHLCDGRANVGRGEHRWSVHRLAGSSGLVGGSFWSVIRHMSASA